MFAKAGEQAGREMKGKTACLRNSFSGVMLMFCFSPGAFEGFHLDPSLTISLCVLSVAEEGCL